MMLSLWIGGSDDGNLAHVTDYRERLWKRLLDLSLTCMRCDHIPSFAKSVVPAGVFGLEPIPLGRRNTSIWVPPHGRTPEPDAEMQAMVIPVQLIQEGLPVPGGLHAEIAELVHKLLDDPLFHELLERHGAVFERRVVVHRESGEQAEEAPASPEHHVYQSLGFILHAVLHQNLQRRLALLGMASLIGLDAGDQGAELYVSHMHSIGGHAQELKVREACLEGKCELDGSTQRIVGSEHVVKDMPSGDRAPFIGMESLMRPVKLRILRQEFVREKQLDLAVTGFVQCAEGSHVTPGCRPSKACHTRLTE